MNKNKKLSLITLFSLSFVAFSGALFSPNVESKDLSTNIINRATIKNAYVEDNNGNLVSDNLLNINVHSNRNSTSTINGSTITITNTTNTDTGENIYNIGIRIASDNSLAGQTLTLSWNNVVTTGNAQMIIGLYDGTDFYMPTIQNGNSLTFTTPSNGTELTVVIYSGWQHLGGVGSLTFSDLMLNKGSIAELYTPYGVTYYSQNNYDIANKGFQTPYSKASEIYAYSSGARSILNKRVYFDFYDLSNNDAFDFKNGSVSYTWKYTDFDFSPTLTIADSDNFSKGIVYNWGSNGFDFTNYDSLYFFNGTISYGCGFSISFIDGYEYVFNAADNEVFKQPLSIKSLGHGSVITSMSAFSSYEYRTEIMEDISEDDYSGPFGFYSTNEYGNGYNTGYNDAIKKVTLSPNIVGAYSTNDYLNYGAQQYADGVQDASTDIGQLNNVFLAIADVPFKILSNFMILPVFGTPLFTIFSSLIVLLIAVYIIKKVV